MELATPPKRPTFHHILPHPKIFQDTAENNGNGLEINWNAPATSVEGFYLNQNIDDRWTETKANPPQTSIRLKHITVSMNMHECKDQIYSA